MADRRNGRFISFGCRNLTRFLHGAYRIESKWQLASWSIPLCSNDVASVSLLLCTHLSMNRVNYELAAARGSMGGWNE